MGKFDDYDVMLTADGSQIEVRMLAEMSRDKLLISQFNSGQDVHCLVGHSLTGWSVERIKQEKNLRKMVKNMHFGIIFGLGRNNLFPYVIGKIRAIDGKNADMTGITEARLQKLYDRYFRVYVGVKKFIDLQRKLAEDRGYVETLFGFRRDIDVVGSGGRATYWANQAINCVDYATTILTKRGWLRGDQLKKDDLCLTDTGWQSPIRIRNWPNYRGPVHVWRSKSFSAVSTPNHRWKVFNRTAGEDQTWTSETLPKGNSEYRIYRTIPEISVQETLSDDFIRLIGWALTDGSYKKDNKVGVVIMQSKVKNIREIRAIMKSLGVLAENGKRQKNWYVGGDLGKKIRLLFPDRALSLDFIAQLSRRQARLLVETMMKGDGSEGRRFCCGDSCREDMATGAKKADVFQALCAWAGFATTVRTRLQEKPAFIKKTGQYVVSKKPCHIVSVLRRTKAQIFPQHETMKEGNGVWCPTFVDDAAWVARREGTTYLTKNTPIQGSAHQFLLVALALIDLKPRTYSLLRRCIMEVHDALYFLVKLRHLPEARAQLMHLFEVGATGYATRKFDLDLQVPLLAESQAGLCMGSMVDYAGGPVDEFLAEWRKKQAKVEAMNWEDLLPVAV